MEEYIAFDSHKRYTWVEHQEANTGKTRAYRLVHGMERERFVKPWRVAFRVRR